MLPATPKDTKPPTHPPFPFMALQAIGNAGRLTAGILKF